MGRKTKHEYKEKIFLQQRLNQLGYVYLQIWIYIFMIYFFIEDYLNIKIGLFMMDNFQVSVLKSLVIIMAITWLLPYTIVFFQTKDLYKEKERLEKQLKKRRAAVHLHKHTYTEDGIAKLGPARKLIRLENRVEKTKARLEMIGECLGS